MSAPNPEAGARLEISALVKRFGSFTAVDSIDLTVPEGAFYALLGPSGCGKSTTLRMVAGLEDPTSGQICLGGRNITHLRAHQRPVNTVFQSYALFPHMSVFDNIAFGLRRRKVDGIARKVGQMLELVELQEVANRRPARLSGGQQQRVALARALVNRPSVLLLDEPLGALDLKLRRQMQSELKRIQTEVGITFVHVTHDQEEAMTMADTIAVMNKGVIEQQGSPVELYENPQTPFVAGFLGMTNLLTTTVVNRGNPMTTVDFKGIRLQVPTARIRAVSNSIEAGVRPEKIRLTAVGQTPPGVNAVQGTIFDVSFVGVSTQYSIKPTADPVDHELTVFAQNDQTHRWRIGDVVSAWWEPEFTFGLQEGSWVEAEAAEVAL